MTDPGLTFCMVTTFYPPYHFGGEAMYLYRLVNALAERGHRVTVVHCVGLVPDAHRRAAARRVPPSPERHGAFARKPWRPRCLAALTYLSGRPGLKRGALREIFDTTAFDVVHFHLVTLFGPGVIDMAPPGALRLYTTHDHWLVCPMYDLWRYNRELCEQPDVPPLPGVVPPSAAALALHAPPRPRAATVDLFLAPSRSTIDQHRRRGFRYPIEQLPYFLPLERGERQPPSEPVRAAGRQAVLPLRRPAREAEGGPDADRGVPALRRRTDLLLAGDGVYAEELRRQAEGLDHVRFLGRVHPDELRGLYRGAVATLVPSLVYETFGFITLESLAQRTPVVATELGAVGELARESGGGLTYGDEDGALAALDRLLDEPGLREELGDRGHGAFLERWSEEPHIERYLSLIADARARRSTGVGSAEPKLVTV